MFRTLKAILGSFWLQIWRDSSIFGVIYSLLRLVVCSIRSRLFSAGANISIHTNTRSYRCMPIKVYVPCSKLRRAYADITQVTADQLIPGQQLASSSYVIQGNYPQLIQSAYICDRIYAPQVVLLNGFNYNASSQGIYMLTYLETMPFQRQVVLQDGLAVQCFCIYAYSKQKQLEPDTLPDILGDFGVLKWHAQLKALSWRAYVQGPTISVIKQLIGHALGSPVAIQNQQVVDVRSQGDTYVVSTNKHLYMSKHTAQVTPQEQLYAGDTIFQGPYMLAGHQQLPAYQLLPGLMVQTSVGPLFAANSVQSSADILNLGGTQSAVADYVAAVQQARTDTARPIVTITQGINTLQFVLKKIQNSRYIIIMTQSFGDYSTMRQLMHFISQLTSRGVIIYTSSSAQLQTYVDLTYTTDYDIVQVTI